MIFYYVKKPCGEVLAYTRQGKAQRVAALYNTILYQPTELEITNASHMYFRS